MQLPITSHRNLDMSIKQFYSRPDGHKVTSEENDKLQERRGVLITYLNDANTAAKASLKTAITVAEGGGRESPESKLFPHPDKEVDEHIAKYITLAKQVPKDPAIGDEREEDQGEEEKQLKQQRKRQEEEVKQTKKRKKEASRTLASSSSAASVPRASKKGKRESRDEDEDSQGIDLLRAFLGPIFVQARWFPLKMFSFCPVVHAFHFCVLDCLAILSYSSGLLFHSLTQEEKSERKGGSCQEKVAKKVRKKVLLLNFFHTKRNVMVHCRSGR
jgi:hypothetical protein